MLFLALSYYLHEFGKQSFRVHHDPFAAGPSRIYLSYRYFEGHRYHNYLRGARIA